MNWAAPRGLSPACSFAFPWGETSTFPPGSKPSPLKSRPRAEFKSSAPSRSRLLESSRVGANTRGGRKAPVEGRQGNIGNEEELWTWRESWLSPLAPFPPHRNAGKRFKSPFISAALLGVWLTLDENHIPSVTFQRWASTARVQILAQP